MQTAASNSISLQALSKGDIEPPGWYVVCRESDLRRKPLRLRIFSRFWAAFRTETGAVGFVEDRCLHRGVALSAGRVRGESLQCPYHGWEYAPDGKVVRVPADPEASEKGAGIVGIALPVQVRQGFVWVAWGEVESGSPLTFDYMGEPGWTSFVMKTRFRGRVDNCLENFLDTPHAMHVHKYWFRAPTSKTVKVVVRSLEDGAEAEFFEEPRKRSVVWWFLSPSKGNMRHVDRFIAPNSSRVDYEFQNGLRYLITSTCTPVNARETEVYTVISFRFRGLGALVRLFFVPLSRLIIRQDVRMIEAQQKNIEECGAGRFVSTPADLLGEEIVAWRAALATGAARPVAFQERHVTIRL